MSEQASRRQAPMPVVNAMTVDVEDYFQVQALAEQFPRSIWDKQTARVERNTDRVLSLFADHGIKATFFTLGWVAERHRSLIHRIVENGHELASHGYEHTRADQQDRNAFRADVRRTKGILEDVSATSVRGYRAATFSIGKSNLWAFEVLAEEGYAYSSSIYPIRHDYYGMPDAPRFPFRPLTNADFLEVPISTIKVAGWNLPGRRWRLFSAPPHTPARNGRSTGSIGASGQASVLYFHPWEIDPDQPRPERLNLKTRVRHYTNLDRMEARLSQLLRDFRWDRMDRVFVPNPHPTG